ncbi:lipopolysaccharide biosynthesis protein [Xenorhabdus sp. PB30.3]|uniref:lipopolysaccharide biosynthesis protein n=1 Tax=Xenorhabdus sp. PB30.3 TaxID=2788941 RepID=UPI001E300E01|nr:oligosaccharide flippase family protein [Xenorhabdus sp. PB30.3]MCC8382093.1 oligosaccharide flippase family protein [Xenorhabdus sp. PB30.3]
MSSLKNNITQLASGTLASQFLLLIITPALTRLYGPESLGGLAIFISLYTVCAGISTLRYELSVPAQKNDLLATEISSVTFIYTTIFSILLMIVIIIFIYIKIKWIPFYYLFLPFCIIFISIHSLTQQWSARNRNYSRYSYSLFINSATNSILIFTFAYYGYNNTEALVAGVFFGIASATFFMLIPLKKRNEIFGGIKIIFLPKKILNLSRINKAFPKFMLPTFLLSSLSSNSPILILGLLRTSTEVGFFSLALRCIQTPGIILGGAISEALRAELFNRHRMNDVLLPIIYKVIKLNIALGIPFFLFMMLIGDKILVLILGSRFEPVRNLVTPLTLIVWATVSLQILQSLFIILEKQSQNLFSQIILSLIPNTVLILLSVSNFQLEKIITIYSIIYATTIIGIIIWILCLTLHSDREKL